MLVETKQIAYFLYFHFIIVQKDDCRYTVSVIDAYFLLFFTFKEMLRDYPSIDDGMNECSQSFWCRSNFEMWLVGCTSSGSVGPLIFPLISFQKFFRNLLLQFFFTVDKEIKKVLFVLLKFTMAGQLNFLLMDGSNPTIVNCYFCKFFASNQFECHLNSFRIYILNKIIF